MIINYDIPYNPTRVIQRVGRINRIDKLVYERIHIYNFFPTAIGERETGLKRISTLKIRLINDGRASVVVRDIDLVASAGNTKISNITSSTQFSVPANSAKVIQLTATISTAGVITSLLNIIEDGLNIPINVTGQILTDLGTLNVSYTKVIGAPTMSAAPLFLNDKYFLYWKKNIQPTGNKLKNVYQYMLNSINTGAKVNEFEIQTESGASIPGAVFLNEVQFMNFEPKSFRAN